LKDSEIEEFLWELKKHGIKNDIPNISLTNARFLRDIIKLQKPKRLLEIGTANAFSSINMALESRKYWGKIETIEFSERSFNIAKENIKKSGLQEDISQLFWNALDIIPKLEWEYNFIFIDGMKRRTKDFFELSYWLLSKWGVMIIDDVILFREKMENLYTVLEGKKIVYNVIPLDVNDGVIMIVK